MQATGVPTPSKKRKAEEQKEAPAVKKTVTAKAAKK